MLAEHPRLYIGSSELDRLKSGHVARSPLLKAASRVVRAQADDFVTMPPLRYMRDCHNEHLLRAREVQIRVVTLLTRWQQTGDGRYRQAVIKLIRDMGRWKYWAWGAWRAKDPRPIREFDLSYGENSTTLAIAYDWLHDSLSKSERQLFLKIANHWTFASARANVLSKAKTGWFGHAQTNWNTVCAGGLGMLALAMYEQIPEAKKLVSAVEKSIRPYFETLDQTDGAWPEGIGYWNYGMRYGFMYLLSHERATGRKHPLLHRPSVRKTLSFPLDFCPNGQPCSFGDVNGWRPLPIHYAAAQRLNLKRLVAEVDASSQQSVDTASSWPDAAEWLLLHDGKPDAQVIDADKPIAKHYKGQDWGVLADRWPNPKLYLSLRGGSTQVPHSHLDLMSFHCVVGNERLITNLGPNQYLDTTFSPRRPELPEISYASKNTVLINGVGVPSRAELSSMRKVRGGDCVGFHLDASSAMGTMRDGNAAKFCARLVLMVAQRVIVIVDRVVLPHVGLIETRLHSEATVQPGKAGAVIRGDKHRLRVSYASTGEAVCGTALPAMTQITAAQPTMLRWATSSQVLETTFVTLLSPGGAPASVEVDESGASIGVMLRHGKWRKQLRLSSRLGISA